MKRYFIITVDTEGDDLWHYQKGKPVKTENTLYIPRFQELCEEYGFKPVYLTNYEMVCDDRFVKYIKPKAEAGLCEVGIHIHAWNNPPLYELNGSYTGNPYLIEYPEEVMREKLMTTAKLIKEKFGTWPVSHRAGRWAMNDTYFKLLKECGVLADCSYTPHVNCKGCVGETIPDGPDYRDVNENAHYIDGVLEIPVSVRPAFLYGAYRVLKRSGIKRLLMSLSDGFNLWVRPSGNTADEMIRVAKKIAKEKDVDYVEMMLHSSELMPGGSPSFKDDAAIENLYFQLRKLFETLKTMRLEGITMKEYTKKFRIE